MSVKPLVKRGLQHVAARIGPQRWPSKQPRLLVLMYHRVLPATHPDMADVEPGMVVTPQTLELHLTLLRQRFTLLHLSEWLALRAAGRPLPPRACVVTFDDGWADNVEFAYPLLRKHGVPATIFLVADWIGSHNEFWPERLARLLRHVATTAPAAFAGDAFAWLRSAPTDFAFNGTPPTREQLNQLFLHCKQWNDDELHERLDQLTQACDLRPPAAPVLMNWNDVATMASGGLVEFGSHTCRHVRLRDSISAELMRHEIVDSRRVIAEASGRAPDTFCYPNGNYTASAVALVRETYKGAVSTDSGWNDVGSDACLLQRIGIHDDVSADAVAFEARISGWL